jgi:hypothetical protein
LSFGVVAIRTFIHALILLVSSVFPTLEIPPAVIIGNDAYIYLDSALYALVRVPDGSWKLRVSLSMCWGCFGDHSFVSATCWGVLCQCCGGTGWEGGDLEFCPTYPLSSDLEVCVETESPKVAFWRLLETNLPVLNPIRSQPSVDIPHALVRGQTAKLEIIAPETRYLAMQTGLWCLVAFEQLCQVCGGRGKNPQDEYLLCPTCGGV